MPPVPITAIRGKGVAIADPSLSSVWELGGGPFLPEAKRYSPISADKIRNDVGQRELCEIQVAPRDKRIALIDQVEDRADNQRDPERAARNAIGNRVSKSQFPAHESQRLRRL